MSGIHWVKLSLHMFDDEKIKAIRSMPEGEALCLIWIQLIMLAGKTNDRGQIYLAEDIPYTDTVLASSIGHRVEVVRLALATFKKMGMIEILANDRIALVNWERHQNTDRLELIRSQTRERVKKYRDRLLLTCNAVTQDVTQNVTGGYAVESESESDIELDTIPRFRSGEFDAFWKAYPRKVGKAAALRKYRAAIKRGVAHSAIMAGVARYVAKLRRDKTESQYVAHPATWLGGGRWEDEESEATAPVKAPPAKCACGTVYLGTEGFCRKCGEGRVR